MDDLVLTHRDGPVVTLTLNRPDRRNPLSLAMIDALRASLDGAGDAGIVVIAAEGPAFSAGHDLREMTGRDSAFYRSLFDACTALMQEIHRHPAPVIAQVQGIATAAGCQLVAACDLVVAADGARFATPGVKIGLFCSTPMVEVSRAVGRKRALQMLLTGETIDAETACEWGLVNRVVPQDALVAATSELALRIASASAPVLALGKQVFYETVDAKIDDAYLAAGAVMCTNAGIADAQEGFTAFLEKRAPRWVGRDEPSDVPRHGH